MRQILWFRRDLRIEDSAILHHAQDEVLPIFIFDTHILNQLPKDDKRVTFIYDSVKSLKQQLQSIGLDLAVFYGNPKEILQTLSADFDELLCSIDFDDYAKKRDQEIEQFLPVRRFIDAFILNPIQHLKSDGTPYKVFTPFYKSLHMITSSSSIALYERNHNLKKVSFDYKKLPTLEEMGFQRAELPQFLTQDKSIVLEQFETKLEAYEEDRDYFFKEATSNLSVHLRFGIISAKQVFNYYRSKPNSDFFIKELFWREFYNYILYHFPQSQFENFNGLNIEWNDNEEDFKRWCEGQTGVPIIDAAMRHLNKTGLMHNRLRMIVASFATKNLFIDWRKAEAYFALKLLDYEASSNIGSWQWSASTGADAAPYFRVFNPYTQSKKFDADGVFIKSVLKELESIPSKLLHIENGVHTNLFIDYVKPMVDIKLSRQRAIDRFKQAKVS